MNLISNIKSQISNLEIPLAFLCALCVSAVQFPSLTFADAPTLAELEGYRTALSSDPDPSAVPVGFRDLWDHPETYQGRVVRIEGRVARTFRQGPIGEFPALVEAWVTSAAGDPICLVFPGAEGRECGEVGTQVRFSGTFLRKVRYRGGDVDRLAPLIVGPGVPELLASQGDETSKGASWTQVDWLLGLGASVVIVGALARRHLGRPVPRPIGIEPPPSFVDGGPLSREDSHEGR